VERSDRLLLGGVAPNTAAHEARRGRGNETLCVYYCSCDKIGQIVSVSNCVPHKDYAVSPEWAFSLLAAKKNTMATARHLIIHCARNVQSNLRNLEGYDVGLRELEAEQELAAARARLQAGARPFRRVAAVESWIAQYQQDRWRYAFLVLDGPSQMGKTAFARSRTPGGRAFLADCSACVEPDLRRFNKRDYDMIIYDEASCSLALRCKRLMQAPPDAVGLGSSPTNMHFYSVIVYKVPMIICSNKWQTDLEAQTADDKAWLLANSIVVRVTEPLWEP